jgi:hypothetical protein
VAEVLLKSFVLASGRDLVDDWLDDQRADVRARAEFLNIMTALRDQPRTEWTRPDYGILRRACIGLGEVRFKVRNVQHRPIGFFIGSDVFVLVAFATERDGEFDPQNTCRTSQNRRTTVLRNPRRAHVCNI